MYLTLDALLIYNLCIYIYTSYAGFHVESHTVVINGYRHNRTLTSGDSVALGTQVILVCGVVGLLNGTSLNYTWMCPNGPCEVEGYYGKKVYNEHILAVNTTSSRDRGVYTCQVTGRQEATGSFTLRVTGVFDI